MDNKRNIRCGILTYHFAANYGAVLQCFALKKALNQFGISTEVINYVSRTQLNNNSIYRKDKGVKGVIKNALLLPFHHIRLERYNRFNCFLKDYILNNFDYINTIADLKSKVDLEFDYVISGSDQVFNPRIIDFNTAFFFPFKTKVKKIGYAVSSGTATSQELLAFKEWIDDFSVITAREASTANTLCQITNKSIFEVCDPVFLIEKTEWENLVCDISEKQFLLCYFVKSQDLKEKVSIAEKIAKERNLDLLILSPRITKYNFSKKVISDAGPIEFLSYFSKADYICTDSFHGTAFSLIFNTPFTTIENRIERTDGRKLNLLNRTGTLCRVYYLGDQLKPQENVDFSKVNIRLDTIKNESKDILRQALFND